MESARKTAARNPNTSSRRTRISKPNQLSNSANRQTEDPLARITDALRNRTRPLNLVDVRRIAGILRGITDAHVQASHPLAAELQRIERDYRFTPTAASLFQNLLGRLGIDSAFEIRIPVEDKPYWMRVEHRLTNFRSKPELPASADVVIIGAGLTGASAAWYLRESAKQGLRVVVVDKGGPASEASGRNGGNFELLPENSVGIYEGLASERLAFLCRTYPGVPVQILQAESERQASVILGIALRNRDCLKQIIEQENLACDFSPRGWLYLAHTEKEEQVICDEVVLAAQQKQQIEVWSRLKIRNEFGFERRHIGRFIPGDGTYHPFKFVCGVLEKSLAFGVEFYTGVTVREILSQNETTHFVTTDQGTIVAGRVIVATNAFTSQIFPELAAIRATQSQIAITEFARDRCHGRIVTSEEGPVYFNQPRASAGRGLAPLLMGGGADRATDHPSSRRRNTKIHARLLRLREVFFPELRNRPFSTEWVGVCGFTPDQLPVVGLYRPGIIVAAGFNGYGGSYCCLSGQVAATMTLSGQGPDWLPEDVFSPQRLLSAVPLFMNGTDGLWRIAVSLCAQLQAVNRQISDAIFFSSKTIRSTAPDHFAFRLSDAQSTSASSVDPALLCALPAFAKFTPPETAPLLAMMRRWDVPGGTLLFSQGSPGSSCFVVLSGSVTVSMHVEGRERLLSTLLSGSIFGQIALIEGSQRTATCATHGDTVLLEIEQDACKRLFATPSATALKFLAALNQGLIDALRGANRQLMRLTVEDRASQPDGPRTEAPGMLERTGPTFEEWPRRNHAPR